MSASEPKATIKKSVSISGFKILMVRRDHQSFDISSGTASITFYFYLGRNTACMALARLLISIGIEILSSRET